MTTTTRNPKGTGLYLLVMEGDVEPNLIGPWSSERERTAAAASHRADHGDRDGLFRVDVNPGGRLAVSSFSGGELDLARPTRAGRSR